MIYFPLEHFSIMLKLRNNELCDLMIGGMLRMIKKMTCI